MKAPFSIATTPRCRWGLYSIPWIAPLILNPYLKMLIDKQGGINYYFKVFGRLDVGLNLGLPDHGRTFYSFGQIMPRAKIPLTSTRYLSLSLITLDKSCWRHLMSAFSLWIQSLTDWLALMWTYVVFHWGKNSYDFDFFTSSARFKLCLCVRMWQRDTEKKNKNKNKKIISI